MESSDFPTLAHPAQSARVRNIRSERAGTNATLILPGGLQLEIREQGGGPLPRRLGAIRAAVEAVIDGGLVIGREDVLEIGKTLVSVHATASFERDGLTCGALERVGRLLAAGLELCPRCESHRGPSLPGARACACATTTREWVA